MICQKIYFLTISREHKSHYVGTQIVYIMGRSYTDCHLGCSDDKRPDAGPEEFRGCDLRNQVHNTLLNRKALLSVGSGEQRILREVI